MRSNEGRIYVEYASGASDGDRELYDVGEDPYQLDNLMDRGDTPTYLRERQRGPEGLLGGRVQVGRGG